MFLNQAGIWPCLMLTKAFQMLVELQMLLFAIVLVNGIGL